MTVLAILAAFLALELLPRIFRVRDRRWETRVAETCRRLKAIR